MSIIHASVTNHDAHNCPETSEARSAAAFRSLILLVHGPSRAFRRHTFDTTHHPLRTMSDTLFYLQQSKHENERVFTDTEIDWETYMYHIEHYLRGERNYSLIDGPTGLLV